MGSPADWGALADNNDLAQVNSKEHQLGEDITAALKARMLGRNVLIGIEEAPREGGSSASDCLVLTNVRSGDRLALTVGRLGRPAGIQLAASSPSSSSSLPSSPTMAAASSETTCLSRGGCEGRLVAVSVECDHSSGASNIVLHLEGEPSGPFVRRLPLRTRALETVLPHLVADEVLSCLPGAWEPAIRSEVVVRASEGFSGEATAWPFMAWWPLLPADWRLAGDGSAALVA